MQTAVRSAICVLLIGGTFVALWVIYRPSPPTPVSVPPPPRQPVLHAAHADVLVEEPARAARHATIACDGRRHRATGFWSANAAEACDALASTRAGLLAKRRCRRTSAQRVRLRARGAFGRRAFDQLQQEGGCPDPDGWLAVNALARPILVPQQKIAPAP
jgi:hypothetical protein